MKNEEKKKGVIFVNVGEMIAKEIFLHHVTKQDFADIVGTDRSNLHRILKKTSLDTDLLFRYSRVLNHNFFRELADEYDHMFTSKSTHDI